MNVPAAHAVAKGILGSTLAARLGCPVISQDPDREGRQPVPREISMPNLFWKTQSGTRQLVDTPFKAEEEFERTVFETADLLEDVFPLKRQIRGGSKSGIPDIVGIDRDGNVCIVEIKNVPVGAEIIPQVLQYAIWAETNPDSIKSLWLECKNRPDDITIAWEALNVRIVVVAPQILRSTVALADKINYQVDLLEINRWIDGHDQMFLVNRIEPDPKPKSFKPVSGLGTYDADFYKAQYNPQSAELFLSLADEVNDLVKRHEWNLERKFNKYYCGFKAGAFNAFGIKWVGTKTVAFFFKLSEKGAAATGVEITRYEKQWKESYLYVEPGVTRIQDIEPLFVAAYRKISGK